MKFKKKKCLQLHVSQSVHTVCQLSSFREAYTRRSYTLHPNYTLFTFFEKRNDRSWRDGRNTNEHEISRAQWHGYSPFVTTPERRKAGEVSDRVFNTRTLPRPVRHRSDTEWNSISKLTKERQPEAGRDSYSRACKGGEGAEAANGERKPRSCVFPAESEQAADICSHEGETGSAWLRRINCVSFYLRLHANWIQRRTRRSEREYEHEHGATLECRGGVGKAAADAGRKKRLHAGSKTRTDTFTYFSARHRFFPDRWHSSSVQLIQTTLSGAAEALGNLRI